MIRYPDPFMADSLATLWTKTDFFDPHQLVNRYTTDDVGCIVR